MINSIVFAIVTYKEKYFECLSYTTLLNSFQVHGIGEELNIVVFDNTDSENWSITPKNETSVSLTYLTQKENTGISFAYNRIHEFAQKNKFEWIVFLDQDTTLPIEAYKVYTQKEANRIQNFLAAPIVLSNNSILSPCATNRYRKLLSPVVVPGLLKMKYYTCINSGLKVNTAFFTAIGGYDEKLKLDFCDHDFIERAKTRIPYLEVLNMEFIQDFSTTNNTLEQSIFRYRLFYKDYIQYAKSRNKIILFFRIDIKHLIKLTLKFKTLTFLKIRMNQI